MDSPSELFKGQLLALIERKLAPLEQEIREQSELIAKLAEQTAALSRPKGLARLAEETKSLKLPKDQPEPETKKTKAEESRAKAEEAKRKAGEEKKAEAKRRHEEVLKKKQEEDKLAKGKKEAEDKKREMDEKRKKDAFNRGKKHPEEGKKLVEEAKKSTEEAKKVTKRPTPNKAPEPTPGPEQIISPLDRSVEAAPPAENKDAVLTTESREATEESEHPDLPKDDPLIIVTRPARDDSDLVVPEPSVNEELDGETLLLSARLSDQPVFVDDEAQPSAPEHEDHSQELAGIEGEITKLLASQDEETLLKTPPFQLSLGAKSAMGLLNTLDETQLYLNSVPSREETMWVFRLFFQLGGKTLPEDRKEAWEVCREFLLQGKDVGMSVLVSDAVHSFQFSNENIDLVEKLLAGKTDKVNPNLYNQFCTLTGLVMFTVKEGVTYAGLIPEKAAAWRRYQRLLYRRGKLVSR